MYLYTSIYKGSGTKHLKSLNFFRWKEFNSDNECILTEAWAQLNIKMAPQKEWICCIATQNVCNVLFKGTACEISQWRYNGAGVWVGTQ